MFSLIITIIAIAIFGVLVSAGINYIDVDGAMSKKDAMDIQSSVIDIGMGMTSFRNLMGKEAVNIVQIMPAFAKVESIPDYVTLISIGNEIYNSTYNRRFSCFLADTSDEQGNRALQRINNQFEDNVILISDCTQTSENATLDSSTTSIHFKYYY